MRRHERSPQDPDVIPPQELASGKLEIRGRLPWASNHTFLATLDAGVRDIDVVYKPRSGERPLWDFSQGSLCQREVAAFIVSEHSGWGIVPPTVLRDGPFGEGSVQFFVEHNPALTAFELIETSRDALRKIALFDLVANNADRKAGHVIQGADGSIWAVDHGICFHELPKLRTVLWEFAGTALSDQEAGTLERLLLDFDSELCYELQGTLTDTEIRATRARVELLITTNAFPQPSGGRHIPWPPV